MSFEENGYLGSQIEQIKRDNYIKHQDIFKRCEDLNRFAQKLKYKFNIKSHDIQGIVAVILYIRIHNAFQGSIIMYQCGLDTEAKTLTRSALEAMFVIKAIVKDEKNLELLKQDNFKQKEKSFGRILKDEYSIFDGLKEKIDPVKYEELKKKNKEENANEVLIFDWAKKSDSLVEYYYAYKTLCFEVHVDIGTFDKYIVADENEEIRQFNAIPCTDELEITLFTAYYALLVAIDNMNHFKNLGIENEIKEFEMILHNFEESIKEEN